MLLYILNSNKSEKLRPMKDVLHVPDFPDYRFLHSLLFPVGNKTKLEAAKTQIQHICEINDKFFDDDLLVRLSKVKVIEWLKKKIEKISGTMKTKIMSDTVPRSKCSISFEESILLCSQ